MNLHMCVEKRIKKKRKRKKNKDGEYSSTPYE